MKLNLILLINLNENTISIQKGWEKRQKVEGT